MQGPIHRIGDPYALEVEDVNSAIDPYFVLSASFFPCLPSPDPSFSQKDDDAQTLKNWILFMHALSVYLIGSTFYIPVSITCPKHV